METTYVLIPSLQLSSFRGANCISQYQEQVLVRQQPVRACTSLQKLRAQAKGYEGLCGTILLSWREASTLHDTGKAPWYTLNGDKW